MNTQSNKDKLGRFTQGNTGKPKGARSRLNAKLKDTLEEVIANEYTAEKIQLYIQELDFTDRLRFFVQLLPYVASKAPAAEVEPEPEENGVIDYSKFTDEELREIVRLQEKARANTTPPIQWRDEPMTITRTIIDPANQ
jgi:hypothetical protein